MDELIGGRHMSVDFTKALAGITALGAGLTVLASATGAFEQMQRNNPQVTALIFSGAVVAGVLVLAAGWTTGDWETALGVAGVVVFAAAAVAGIFFLVKSRGERPPPSIKVSFKQGPPLAIAGSIKADQVTSKETLKVRVVANTSPDNRALEIGTEDRLLDARMGSDASGAIDLPLDVPIPPKEYVWVNVLAWVAEKPDDCFGRRTSYKNTPGCVAIRIPKSVAAR